MLRESTGRSLVKGLTWRFIASITTTLIALYYGIPSKAIGLVFFTDLVVKYILYVTHERVWLLSSFGLKEDKKDSNR